MDPGSPDGSQNSQSTTQQTRGLDAMVVRGDDPRLAKVGFVKLEGQGIEFYAKKYEIVIGRPSKAFVPDVVITDNMNISRQHAVIAYNFDTERWELTVLGKNGVSVDERLCLPGGEPVVLHSGMYLEMGKSGFHFLLPVDDEQLEWGYMSEGLPTQGPTRTGANGSGLQPPPSQVRQSGELDEMDVTSNLSPGALGYRASQYPGGGRHRGAARPGQQAPRSRNPAQGAHSPGGYGRGAYGAPRRGFGQRGPAFDGPGVGRNGAAGAAAHDRGEGQYVGGSSYGSYGQRYSWMQEEQEEEEEEYQGLGEEEEEEYQGEGGYGGAMDDEDDVELSE